MPSLSTMVLVPFALPVFSFNRKGKTIVWRWVAKWILNVLKSRGVGRGHRGGIANIYSIPACATLSPFLETTFSGDA